MLFRSAYWRRHFAGLAMQGLIVTLGADSVPQDIAYWSVRYAEELLAKLKETSDGEAVPPTT